MSDETYAPLSTLAVLSAVSALLVPLGIDFPETSAAVALISIPLGIAALMVIRKFDLKGKWLAYFGILVSALGWGAIQTWHLTQYIAESLPGCRRIDFAQVSTEDGLDLSPYVGDRVCLKGYKLIPEPWPAPPELFSMSADGDEERRNRAVWVSLRAGIKQAWDYDEPLAVSGILVPNSQANPGSGNPPYVLRDAVINKCRTRADLVVLRKRTKGC